MLILTILQFILYRSTKMRNIQKISVDRYVFILVKLYLPCISMPTY